MTALDPAFFSRSVHTVARGLIGCTLLYDGVGGVIVETESYHADDPACHGYGGRTERNRSLFGPPGRAYVYRSYGLHLLLNFVAEVEGRAAAVLIRAVEPEAGIEQMRARRSRVELSDLCSGPGKLGEALAIDLVDDGSRLDNPPFAVLGREGRWRRPRILAGPRVGISKAVDYPWRFCAVGSAFVSRPRPSVAARL